MAVNYIAAVKNTRMTAVLTAMDAQAGPAVLEICTAAYAATLITYTLGDPSATVAADVLTLAGLPKTANASAGGTAAVARIKDGAAGSTIVNGLTVGTSATDIIISNTTITNGAPYSLTAGTITHAA